MLNEESKITIPKDTLIDTKILVKHSENDSWLRCHFATFTEDGKVRAWYGGRTSFTACNDWNYTRDWEYAKLYDESEEK